MTFNLTVLLSVALAFWRQDAAAAPALQLGSTQGEPGSRVSIDVDYEGTGSGVDVFEAFIRFDTINLVPSLTRCGGSFGRPANVVVTCEVIGLAIRIQGVASGPEIPDISLGTISFDLAVNAPTPATYLLEIEDDVYRDGLNNVRPRGRRNGFIITTTGQPLPELDRFEVDDTPLTARFPDSNAADTTRRSDRHWFHTADDEDWIIFRLNNGIFEFDVCEGICGDGSQITPNVQIFDATRVVDPNAEPLAEFNECAPNGVPIPVGREIVDAGLGITQNSEVVLIRIRECFGLNGNEFPYDVFMNVSEFNQLGARITGNVSDGDGGPVGTVIFTSTNQITASNPLSGEYSSLVTAGTPIELTVVSENFPEQTIEVSPLGIVEIRTVDIVLLGDAVFGDGFE
ncbi:MAG: hypothetical protein AAGI67_11650 [Pseudomonadota bacterium]